MRSKSSLAVFLSKLKTFEKPKIQLEQYTTDSEVAAEVLWNALMKGDLEDLTIGDLGAGTGILGIGALALGAKKVYFVEKDETAIKTLKENLDEYEFKGEWEIISSDIEQFDQEVDVVIQNPPFGTKKEHADKQFLEKAMNLGKVIYSLHKTSTLKFIEAISLDHDFAITEQWDFDYPLKNTQKHHKKKLERIKVSCWRLEKE